jgi:FHS family L-fucose permease-like MFS transporter
LDMALSVQSSSENNANAWESEMANISAGNPASTGNAMEKAPFALVAAVVALFFLWGGLTSLNDVLIPKLKGHFQLSYTEAMLTQFAFFMAYFIVSLPAGKLIARVGYLKGIVIGLGVMASGCLLFVPASGSGIYATFLAALFVLAAGITILQVAANPLIANLGSSATSHSRLTFAQAFNSLGTTIFPPIGGALILGAAAPGNETGAVSQAYVGIAIALAIMAAFFWWKRTQLPTNAESATQMGGSFGLLRLPRLGGGVASIFLYVGAEVSIGSMLINYLSQSSVMGVSELSASGLIAFYWGGAMVGRFIGAAVLRLFSPGKVLASVACGAAALVLISAASSGAFAGWALLCVGLMNAIMFPTIFSLGVEGLGEKTPQGSGLLCMGIVGGALIPLMVGVLADASSLATSLIIPAICYLLIAAYGWSARHPA